MAERWASILDWPYEVSDHGRVRRVGGKPLKLFSRRRRYILVGLHDAPRKKTFTVHSLVLTAFLGVRPTGMVAAHLNGDSNDNRADNLAWVTPQENAAHKMAHGTATVGDRNGNAVITADDVVRLRLKRSSSGATYDDLADEFGVSRSTVCQIVRGVTWRDVGGPIDDGGAGGERHPMARLTARQVDGIRSRLADGENGSSLAAEYGVARSTISAINTGKTWPES